MDEKYCHIGNRDGVGADVSHTSPPADGVKVIVEVSKQGPPGPKGDPGEVDYNRVGEYVSRRMADIFGTTERRVEKLEHDVRNKLKLLDWMEE